MSQPSPEPTRASGDSPSRSASDLRPGLPPGPTPGSRGVVREVDWRAVFPCLNIFRTFRIAIHPSKLILALVFILMMYGLGRGLDAVWPAKFTHASVPGFLDRLPLSYASTLSRSDKSGPFEVFLNFQLTQLHFVSESVVKLDTWGAVDAVRSFVFVGPGWGFRMHPVFSVIFGVVFLVLWGLFGGAIARVAAVHIARDEKISIRNALRFSTGKLLSFITAPLILFSFIGIAGLALAVSNLLFYIPWGIGPLLTAAVFILTLLVGFVLTLALFGTVGGFGLMYPTVAVEGTDAFDAISRSFSYFFARPWHLLLYSAAALVYGVITYLFVKYFVFIMFVLIQTFHVWLLGDDQRKQYEKFFPPVNFESLSYAIDYSRMDSLGIKVGAGLMSFWFYLVVGLLGAYAMSYYFSAQTVIYYLLRRDVDATELDEVYLDDADEDDLAEQALPDTDLPPNSPDSPDSPGPDAAASQNPPSGSSNPDASEDPPTLGASGPAT